MRSALDGQGCGAIIKGMSQTLQILYRMSWLGSSQILAVRVAKIAGSDKYGTPDRVWAPGQLKIQWSVTMPMIAKPSRTYRHTKLSNSLCLRISGMSCRRSTRRCSRQASRVSEPHKRMTSCPRPSLAKNIYSRLGNLSGRLARMIMETCELRMTRSFIARNILQTWPLTSVRRQIACAEHVSILDISMPPSETLWA